MKKRVSRPYCSVFTKAPWRSVLAQLYTAMIARVWNSEEQSLVPNPSPSSLISYRPWNQLRKTFSFAVERHILPDHMHTCRCITLFKLKKFKFIQQTVRHVIRSRISNSWTSYCTKARWRLSEFFYSSHGQLQLILKPNVGLEPMTLRSQRLLWDLKSMLTNWASRAHQNKFIQSGTHFHLKHFSFSLFNMWLVC